MTLFHTEYELKKQDLKLTEELFENPEKFKEELKEAINEENHRSNVDRAKKNLSHNILTMINFIKWF